MQKQTLYYLHYKQVKIEMTNGIKFKVRASIKNSYLKLEIDPIMHSAWTKEINFSSHQANEILKFNTKFRGLKLNQ